MQSFDGEKKRLAGCLADKRSEMKGQITGLLFLETRFNGPDTHGQPTCRFISRYNLG